MKEAAGMKLGTDVVIAAVEALVAAEFREAGVRVAMAWVLRGKF